MIMTELIAGNIYQSKGRKKRIRRIVFIDKTKVIWVKCNGTREHMTSPEAFHFWIETGKSLFRWKKIDSLVKRDYLETEFKKKDKSVLNALRMGNIRHKVHGERVWIHKDDYRRSKIFLFGIRYGSNPEHMQKYIQVNDIQAKEILDKWKEGVRK